VVLKHPYFMKCEVKAGDQIHSCILWPSRARQCV
jgi:hypothetical protein